MKFCPFIPELIIANNIELGPTKGLTIILFLCAFDTNIAPGFAMHGEPESDNKPKEIPLKHGIRKLSISC